jgi:hypothetical protein
MEVCRKNQLEMRSFRGPNQQMTKTSTFNNGKQYLFVAQGSPEGEGNGKGKGKGRGRSPAK